MLKLERAQARLPDPETSALIPYAVPFFFACQV
jgi:hypothetical protein